MYFQSDTVFLNKINMGNMLSTRKYPTQIPLKIVARRSYNKNNGNCF